LDKVATGIKGFDELLHGGFLRGNTILVEGVPGAGKTTFGIEFIYHGITKFNEPGIIVTFEELPESLYRDTLNLGWDLKALEKANKLRVLCTSPELLLDPEVNLIETVVQEIGAKRILVDSISHFQNVFNTSLPPRRAVYSFCNGLRRLGLTSILVKERVREGAEGYTFEEYLVDAVIHLDNKERPGLHRHRMLEITKTRGQEHVPGKHTFSITNEGIKVYRLLSSVDIDFLQQQTNDILHTGIQGLDDLLQGGLPRGISIAVAGSPGTGKTSLGLQYLVKGAQEYGEKGLFLSLEEPPQQLINNARLFNWDILTLQKEEKLIIKYLPLPKMEIDETIVTLTEWVKSLGASRLVIDSVDIFLSRLDNTAMLYEKFFVLVSELNKLKCTTLLIMPSWQTQDSRKVDVLHSVVQGTILLRSELIQNRRVRQLEIYKMRGVNHAMGNHLFEINPSGIRVFPRLGG